MKRQLGIEYPEEFGLFLILIVAAASRLRMGPVRALRSVAVGTLLQRPHGLGGPFGIAVPKSEQPNAEPNKA